MEVCGWFTEHNARGFQLESSIGIVVEFFGDLGLCAYSLVANMSTYDVDNSFLNLIVPYWTFVFGALIAVVYLVIGMRIRKDRAVSPDRLCIYATLIVLAFLLFYKVFSTQYILWLLPFFLIFP